MHFEAKLSRVNSVFVGNYTLYFTHCEITMAPKTNPLDKYATGARMEWNKLKMTSLGAKFKFSVSRFSLFDGLLS